MSPHESPQEPGEIPSEEVLIRNGTSSQYFNELLISKVIEEVRLCLNPENNLHALEVN